MRLPSLPFRGTDPLERDVRRLSEVDWSQVRGVVPSARWRRRCRLWVRTADGLVVVGLAVDPGVAVAEWARWEEDAWDRNGCLEGDGVAVERAIAPWRANAARSGALLATGAAGLCFVAHDGLVGGLASAASSIGMGAGLRAALNARSTRSDEALLGSVLSRWRLDERGLWVTVAEPGEAPELTRLYLGPRAALHGGWLSDAGGLPSRVPLAAFGAGPEFRRRLGDLVSAGGGADLPDVPDRLLRRRLTDGEWTAVAVTAGFGAMAFGPVGLALALAAATFAGYFSATLAGRSRALKRARTLAEQDAQRRRALATLPALAEPVFGIRDAAASVQNLGGPEPPA